MSQLAIIADDLTGAADAAAPFAQAGFCTYLNLTPGMSPPADVLAISTESRYLAPAAARGRVYQAVAPFSDATWVFKKIDSTLRGQPGAELDAVMDVLGVRQALVAPAFPDQGRTTVGGQQRVNGLPLEKTPFACEVSTSDVALVLYRGLHRVVHLLDLATVRRGVDTVCTAINGLGVYVADAETDDDLITLARAAVHSRLHLLCGSAGLSRALVNTLPLTRTPCPPVPAHHVVRPVLIVAGSRHPRTLRQVYAACDDGAALITPDADFAADNRVLDHVVRMTADSLAGGRHTVLSTAAMAPSPLGGEAVAAALAQVVRCLASPDRIGALILTGGDVAAAILSALEATALHLQGELESGIPWGVLVGGLLAGIPVVTKAGGFGDDDTLAEAVAFLTPVLNR